MTYGDEIQRPRNRRNTPVMMRKQVFRAATRDEIDRIADEQIGRPEVEFVHVAVPPAMISCGCCKGDPSDRCCCFNHQDVSRGLQERVCNGHSLTPYSATVYSHINDALPSDAVVVSYDLVEELMRKVPQ